MQIILRPSVSSHFCGSEKTLIAILKLYTMNTIISNPKTELLLGASLTVLHQESREWLDTVDFWRDEVKFFATILDKREVKKSEYGRMLNHLDKVHENLFDYLTEDIKRHENLLARLERGEKGISDGEYREEHRRLHGSMVLFENDIKEFKKMVFGYVKKL